MTTIRVHQWDKWQTFRKDRGTPSWIKVHRNLLSNPEWAELTDAEKGQLVSIWIVAADKHGEICDNPRIIRKICQLDEEPNINRFIDLGFMVTSCQPSGNQVVTSRGQNDCSEESREEKSKDTSAAKPPTCPHSEIINIYHECLPMLPRVVESIWSESGGALDLRQRWKEKPEHQNLDFWRGFFSSVATNDWWVNPDSWGKANLRWLIKKKRFYEVVQYWANQAVAA